MKCISNQQMKKKSQSSIHLRSCISPLMNASTTFTSGALCNLLSRLHIVSHTSVKTNKTDFLFFFRKGNNLRTDRRGAITLTSVILSELTPLVRKQMYCGGGNSHRLRIIILTPLSFDEMRRGTVCSQTNARMYRRLRLEVDGTRRKAVRKGGREEAAQAGAAQVGGREDD